METRNQTVYEGIIGTVLGALLLLFGAFAPVVGTQQLIIISVVVMTGLILILISGLVVLSYITDRIFNKPTE